MIQICFISISVLDSSQDFDISGGSTTNQTCYSLLPTVSDFWIIMPDSTRWMGWPWHIQTPNPKGMASHFPISPMFDGNVSAFTSIDILWKIALFHHSDKLTVDIHFCSNNAGNFVSKEPKTQDFYSAQQKIKKWVCLWKNKIKIKKCHFPICFLYVSHVFPIENPHNLGFSHWKSPQIWVGLRGEHRDLRLRQRWRSTGRFAMGSSAGKWWFIVD